MLTAVHEDRLTIERLIELMATNPRRIYNLPEQPDTQVEIDMNERYVIRSDSLYTKCGWTPFEGWEVQGQVNRVILEGRVVFENGRILAEPGTGQLL
jgi:carbamoyl-phosphate synthase/aspartate carbamoyltransferase/dihydroorotase